MYFKEKYFLGTETIGIQTSLTDLSNLSKKPEVHDVKIQCNIPISFPSTTSSSQTEEKSLLRNANPIGMYLCKMICFDYGLEEENFRPEDSLKIIFACICY